MIGFHIRNIILVIVGKYTEMVVLEVPYQFGNLLQKIKYEINENMR